MFFITCFVDALYMKHFTASITCSTFQRTVRMRGRNIATQLTRPWIHCLIARRFSKHKVYILFKILNFFLNINFGFDKLHTLIQIVIGESLSRGSSIMQIFIAVFVRLNGERTTGVVKCHSDLVFNHISPRIVCTQLQEILGFYRCLFKIFAVNGRVDKSNISRVRQNNTSIVLKGFVSDCVQLDCNLPTIIIHCMHIERSVTKISFLLKSSNFIEFKRFESFVFSGT